MQDVVVGLDAGALTCRVEGVYPAPNLTWSSELAQLPLLHPFETRSSQDQLGLYHIVSLLRPAAVAAEGNRSQGATYTCHVASGQDKKSASIRHEGEERGKDKESSRSFLQIC